MENLVEVLAARHLVYSAIQALFASEPTPALLGSVDAALLEEALAYLGDESTTQAGTALIVKVKDADGLEALYTRLFVGPAGLQAPPWESVYRSNSRALFQRSTLDVRNAYREQGLLPQLYPRVADDHIALELGFLAMLAKRTLDAAAGDDPATARQALDASAHFLNEHLLAWIDAYAADLSDAAPDTLYSALAALARSFAHCDAKLVARLRADM